MNVYLSGASGFIGRNIYDLLGNKFSISIIDRNLSLPEVSSNDVLILAHAAVEFGQKELDIQELFDANVLYTDKLIKHFEKSKVIYLSTASIYNNIGYINNNTEVNPRNSYSISKFWAEQLIQQKCDEYYVLRLSSVYGEGMKNETLIPNYVDQFIKTNRIEVWGKGERTQNYIHVSDVVKLIEKILFIKENKKGVYLCVDSLEYSNFEIANFITKYNNAEVRLVGKDYSKSLRYNNNDTKLLFDWNPGISIEDGLKSYIEWKRKQS